MTKFEENIIEDVLTWKFKTNNQLSGYDLIQAYWKEYLK